MTCGVEEGEVVNEDLSFIGRIAQRFGRRDVLVEGEGFDDGVAFGFAVCESQLWEHWLLTPHHLTSAS